MMKSLVLPHSNRPASGLSLASHMVLIAVLLLSPLLVPGIPSRTAALGSQPATARTATIPASTLPHSQAEGMAPSGIGFTATSTHTLFLPLVAMDYEAFWDGLILEGTQSYAGGERTVLLSWREPPAALDWERYAVYRRFEGEEPWQPIGQAQFALSAQALADIVGQPLMDQLAWDLRGSSEDDPLTYQEIYDTLLGDAPLARLAADQYYEVGLGIGLAYLDKGAPADRTLEYRVERTGVTSVNYRTISLHPFSTQPGVTGLREVWPGPDTLGQRPSDRPEDAPERYHWDATQEYRSWDGAVYLIWDLPVREPSGIASPTGEEGITQNGYNVYRAEAGTGNWELVNPRVDCHAGHGFEKMYCTLTVKPSAQTDDGYFFQEDLKSILADPADIYADYDYQVCPVDKLRQEGPCSDALTVSVRELDPPAAVTGLVAEPEEGHVWLNLTWVYSDTTELSPPLRFYVTRSPSTTLPLEQWMPVVPLGHTDPYVQVSTTTPMTITIEDLPPRGEVFWYRVQVRDNAGNWSAPSSPAMGALFPRTPPTFDPIPYDSEVCANNDMPLYLEGLDEAILAIAVYRSFAPSGPWQLIDHLPVTNGQATLYDDYLPPYPADAYYQLEAMDGHGNVSGAQPYCARLNPGTTPLPPDVDWQVGDTTADYWAVELTWDDYTAAVQVVATQPGAEGNETTTETVSSDSYTWNVPWGAWFQVGVSDVNENGPGEETPVVIRNTNNFLNTNRQMTSLGPLHDVRWTRVDGEPAARLTIHLGDIHGFPQVAAFRRIPDGNWMQVTPVQAARRGGLAAPLVISDTADLSPNQAYEYVVLSFSPMSYEVLGFWGPTTLAASTPDPDAVRLTSGISPVPGPPPGCSHGRYPGSDFGMPSYISLDNGWSITGVYYWVSEDPDCPGEMSSFDANHAYGDGQLSNGARTWPVEFYDIGVDSGGVHVANPIVAPLNVSRSAPPRFDAYFGDIEFRPGRTRAEVTLTLPENIKVVHVATGDRSHRVTAVFEELTTDWSFDRLAVSSSVAFLLDENLPWQLDGNPQFTPSEVQFDATIRTRDRLDYAAPAIEHPARPDNNLAFLRSTYNSGDAYVDIGGLKGSFVCEDAIEYSTSLPAAVVVTARGGANLGVVNSRIQSGNLLAATARLDYFDAGTVTDYAVPDMPCVPGGSQSLLCTGYLLTGGPAPGLSYRTLLMDPVGGDITLEQGGLFTSPVTLDQEVAWTRFNALEKNVTLYVAAAAFDDAPTSWAPMPAENAWRQLKEPRTGGDLDPGINVNVVGGKAQYHWYQPPDFDNVDLDLYVRRGGVSEHLLILPSSSPQRTNDWNYIIDVVRLELFFVDNGISNDPICQEDLYLPYPTDVVFPLEVEEWSGDHPLAGGFRSPVTALHKYWRLEEKPTAWRYTFEMSPYGETLGDQGALFTLSATVTINGLSHQSTSQEAAPVTMPIESEWLPDGDFGDIEFEPDALPAEGFRVSGVYFAFTDVKLSRYHSIPLDPASLPDTLGLDLNDNMGTLPSDLLDETGKLTGQSLLDCAQPGDTVGCGFVVLDGDGAVEHFGEIGEAGTAIQAPADVPADRLHGDFPIASTDRVSNTQQMVIRPPQLTWSWPLVNALMDLDIPVKFLGNSGGGALVGVWPKAPLLPFLEVFEADLAVVAVFDWNIGAGFDDKIGIFTGYSASQAAFRALAMNRPLETGSGVRPFDQWLDVADDVESWARKFGYTHDDDRTNDNDPVDLAFEIWEDGWCNVWAGNACINRVEELDDTYNVLVPVLQDMDGQDAYNGSGMIGVTGLEAGSILQATDTSLNTGTGQALFVIAGSGLRLENLYFGAQVIVEAEDEPLLDARWLSLEYNRDGIITIRGEEMDIALPGDYRVTANLLLQVGTQAGSEFIEGGITIDSFTITELVLHDLGVAFGAGQIQGELIAYLGLTGDAEFAGYQIGGSILFGSIYPQSQVLRMVGFGDLLDTLGGGDTPSSFIGAYLAFRGDFPLVEGSCLLEASAGGELRLWYFWDVANSQSVYGGQIAGHVYATVACLLSARGDLSLSYAEVGDGGNAPPPPGEDPHTWPLNRTCHNTHGTCTSFGGSFWVAVGVGWCEPSTWHSWGSRWWGDSWCYTVGAWAALSYLNPPEPGSGKWQYDYDLDYE